MNLKLKSILMTACLAVTLAACGGTEHDAELDPQTLESVEASAAVCGWVAFLDDNGLHYVYCCGGCDWNVIAEPDELELCSDNSWQVEGSCETPVEKLKRKRAEDILRMRGQPAS